MASKILRETKDFPVRAFSLLRQAAGRKEPFGQQFHHWDKMKDTVEVRPTEVWGKVGQFAVSSSADCGCV